MTIGMVEGIIGDVALGIEGWEFRVGALGDGFYLQVRIQEEGVYDGWGCRKWYVSQWATPSEVVQTAFLAVKTAAEHELRESFKYCGKAIFGPHFDVSALATLDIPHDLRPSPLPRDSGHGTTNPVVGSSTLPGGTKKEDEWPPRWTEYEIFC